MTGEPIVGLGEVLWDLFPAGPRLGGAPFNFAFHCHQLGHAAVMVSRVGADDRGRAIRAALSQCQLTDDFLQEDPIHPTGTVAVSVDERGQPTFDITPKTAWDYLAWDDRLESLCAGATAVCFGTLMQRHPVSRATLRQALGAARAALVICDINLRQHYFDREMIETSLHASRWLKLNHEELPVLRDLLGLRGGSQSALLADLRRGYDLALVCLTCGADGCLIQTAEEEVAMPGEKVTVVDTVGAGDAFTAGLLCLVLEGRSLAEAAAFANRFAARVAAAPGGTPRIHRADVEK